MAEDAVGPDSGGATGDGLSTSDPESEGDEDAYGGVFGAFPYSVRTSDSWLFRSYALLGGLAALLITLLFGLALVVLLGNTVGAGGGRFSFVRAFFIFVGLLVVAPLVAPVLFVARRHRRGRADGRFDRALAALGYLFLGSLYLAAVISAPAGQRQLPGGVLDPLVAALYALPRLAGLVPPVLVAAAMVVVARRSR